MTTKSQVEAAKQAALRLLKTAGIEDAITVKIHACKADGESVIGMYRGASQFRGNATFWISDDLEKLMEEADVPADCVDGVIVDTIIHEYGHVVWEYLRVRGGAEPAAASLWEDIRALSAGSAYEDEEEFAENFALAISGRLKSPAHLRFAKRFGDLLRGQRP